jgi:hypothetical protein
LSAIYFCEFRIVHSFSHVLSKRIVSVAKVLKFFVKNKMIFLQIMHAHHQSNLLAYTRPPDGLGEGASL